MYYSFSAAVSLVPVGYWTDLDKLRSRNRGSVAADNLTAHGLRPEGVPSSPRSHASVAESARRSRGRRGFLMRKRSCGGGEEESMGVYIVRRDGEVLPARLMARESMLKC